MAELHPPSVVAPLQGWADSNEARRRTAGHPPAGLGCTRSAPGAGARRANARGACGVMVRREPEAYTIYKD